ncbi:MAG TPA: sulfate ABC transporter permease subunit CysW [Pirellulaceae bacterium]|jgi:sulfate transport system permease protein|nr:sulfate ABC transporter permease subunit CysW [Pirellulaceae bacterium]
MSAAASPIPAPRFRGKAPVRSATDDPVLAKIALILGTLTFLGLFLFLPLGAIFFEAFRRGAGVYFASLVHPEALAAVRMTLFATAVCVPVNVAFGLCAAWAIAKFDFRGKSFLITLIDLPFAVSPVIAGLVFVLVFGVRGWLGESLDTIGFDVIFATPGVILATLFVTFPFVARELIPLMQEQGSEEEEAAIVLGASGWQTFFRVTLPNIRWALVYGTVLCTARAMGEFGAVAVVAGNRGRTNTMPLYVELLYNEGKFAAAFAIASLLTMVGLMTLILKTVAELRLKAERKALNDTPNDDMNTPAAKPLNMPGDLALE